MSNCKVVCICIPFSFSHRLFIRNSNVEKTSTAVDNSNAEKTSLVQLRIRTVARSSHEHVAYVEVPCKVVYNPYPQTEIENGLKRNGLKSRMLYSNLPLKYAL